MMAIGVIEQLKEYAKCSNGNGNCEKCFGDWNCGGSCHEHAKMLLQDLDAREVKRGHWERKENDNVYWYVCSECKDDMSRNKYGGWSFPHYCPNCGADMRGEENDL